MSTSTDPPIPPTIIVPDVSPTRVISPTKVFSTTDTKHVLKKNEEKKKSGMDITFRLESANSLVEKVEETESSTRYLILLLTIICLSSLMSNIVCFNFTILCMPASHHHHHQNTTIFEPYNHEERTWLFSAVAIGAILAVVPASHLISRIGTRHVFFAAGLLTATSTLAIPLLSALSFRAFLVLRFLQGISFATCMPTVGSVTASWASLNQHGLFIAVLTTFGQLSSVFSMPISGQLCVSSLGWQSVFYAHSAISFLSFTIWFHFFTNSPHHNQRVTPRELTQITANKSSSNSSDSPIPYLQIITTPSIWAVWVGAFGDLVAVQLIHMFSPLYIRDILGYSVSKTGFAAALPVLFQFFVKISAGHSSDRIAWASETTKLRIFNSIALGMSALFLAACGYVEKGQGLLGLMLITLATAMFGFNGGGFNKCATLVSRQYSPFVMANIQFIWCLSMLICPMFVSLLLPTSSVAEWRVVFVAHATILLLTNAFFCAFATAKPAQWTGVAAGSSASKNRSIFSAYFN